MHVRLPLVACLLCSYAVAQLPDAPTPQIAEISQHRFFDRQATLALAGSAALFTADAVNSCMSAGHEVVLPVQSCHGISLWMAMNSAEQIGLSYLLHRTGHHRLERVAEVFGSAGSAMGIAYTSTHRRDAVVPPPQLIPVQDGHVTGFCIVGSPGC